ncbi:hypothetical protein PHLGIDRAFT_229951 [Phlebiopsis gigantea 11061_1 CR5-6]|uniref:Uncharacterized protein n=1 Tax=Phlebiopsis gigantea (strain 11061_1 CR5-6) TaxID=745531 RepID=A0A0C3NYD3_PHLG1|nr:hypothetical protein PHLGIDRAFT_229951 [Phlebiopsis gigantea 11061_1 CR5-6]
MKSSPLPGSGLGNGLRMPRGRAASAAAAGPLRPSAFKSTLPTLRSESPVGDHTTDPVTPRAPFASSPLVEPESPNPSSASFVSDPIGRSRATSSASTASVRTAASTGSSSSHRMPAPKSAPAVPLSSKLQGAPGLRARTESNASNSTDVTAESSVASNYSQNSSSTSVPSSSSSSVPRPLRLPNTHVTGLKFPGRSYSQDITSSSAAKSTPSSGVPAFFGRPRTVSSPHAPRSPKVAPFTTRTTSNSLASGVLPPGAPPTLRQRERTSPGGARPLPRTGTGMVYRTSSYSSFHESGSRMRQSGVVSP